MLVMVLGAGPAGLLAAEAAHRSGATVVVFSKGKDGEATRSPLHGCQYLHAPTILEGIPGTPVDYRLEGTSNGYRAKVYGPDYRGSVSPDQYVHQKHMAWDLRRAYQTLWEYWGTQVLPMDLKPSSYASLLEHWAPDLVLSTVPAPALCYQPNEHKFPDEMVWAKGQLEDERNFFLPCAENTVVCNGERDVGWYRKARVFSVTTVEWPAHTKPPIEGVVQVRKPLSTDCDCWQTPSHVRLGRYGQWRKGVLAHDVWHHAEVAVHKAKFRGTQDVLW